MLLYFNIDSYEFKNLKFHIKKKMITLNVPEPLILRYYVKIMHFFDGKHVCYNHLALDLCGG